MPVGHERINAREQDPNSNITFIRALPEYPNHDEALHLMKSLAAQFKPIMQKWHFAINSLVEYEPNPVFAGRNWNAGEVVEIVLRRKEDGSFLPWNFILFVMCHECAHIKEMNHSWAFQSVNKQLRQALGILRKQGYTGDGFYGKGRTLNPTYQGNDTRWNAVIGPTYTCGGALKKGRRRRILPNADGTNTAPKPRRERGSAVTLGSTGRQTAIPKKAGRRVTKKDAFKGEGQTLGAKSESDDEGEVASTKGLRTQSKAGRSAREIAATQRLEREQRLRAIEARANGTGSVKDEGEGEGEDDWEFEEEEEEDKPEIAKVEKRFGRKEKDYLRDEIRDWEDELSDDESGTSAKGKAKGKKRQRSVRDLEERDAFEEGFTQEEKDAFERLDEQLYGDLEEEGRQGQVEGPHEDSDDDIIIIEPQPSTSNPKKKKPKVALCSMPKCFGGIGKSKVRSSILDDESSDWIDEA
ncbi:hypothetical protein JCM16303_001802 [Sporobolomyces ruberrimus]